MAGLVLPLGKPWRREAPVVGGSLENGGGGGGGALSSVVFPDRQFQGMGKAPHKLCYSHFGWLTILSHVHPFLRQVMVCE